MATAAPFTCIACRLFFSVAEEQRSHYKKDLHRFNLKRKVAGLPPVTQEMFDKKVDALKVEATEEKNETFYCTICKKQYGSEKSLQAHLNSNKHKEREGTGQKLDKEMNIQIKRQEKILRPHKPTAEQTQKQSLEDDMTEDEWIAYKVANAHKFEETECLFCHEKSTDLISNAKHMTKHGFFIPDIEYLVDLKGLIEYLGAKIGVGNVCLYCDSKGRSFPSLKSVQSHMIIYSHCKIAYEDNEDEYGDFYDFSSTYGETDPNMTPDELEQFIKRKSTVEVSDDGLELVLSSGRVVGHRTLSVYYRQQYKPADMRDSVVLTAAAARYPGQLAIAGAGATGYNPRTAPVTRRSEFLHKKLYMQVGIKHNFHWCRPQVLF